MKLGEMVKSFTGEIKAHWSKPAKGNHISYKEMVAYSVGGMGVNFIAPLVTYITLGAQSLLVGSTFGITPMHLQIMNIISLILQGYIVTPIRGMILDNTRSKYGKFRPYILTMGLPTALLCCLLVFLPVDQMTYMQKAIAVFVVYNMIQVTYLFFQGSYGNLVQVMSPNTEERATTMSISSVVYSLAPTITGFLIPILADIYKEQGGMSYIGTYRIVMPVFSILGLLLSLFAFFGTRERLVVAKKYVPKVGFAEGISKMSKNKYFWIILGTGWIGILKGAVGAILPWLFVYDVQNNALFGIMTTVMGTSALFPMLLAPVFIKWLGKKNIQLFTNFLAAAACILMVPVVYMKGAASATLLFILLYVFNFAAAFLIIVNPAMHAEMRDYQQYRTGDRLEGIEGTLGGLVGTVVTAVVGLIIPAMQEQFGLLDNYNVLFDRTIRQNIFVGLALISCVGSILTGVPYFFYDLSERKHYNLIKVLKVRALFADYRNGDLTDSRLVDTINAIDEAIEMSQNEKLVISKDGIKTAKALPKGTKDEKIARMKAIRDAKKQLKKDIAFNEKVDAAVMVVKEVNKFSDPQTILAVEKAKKLIEVGPIGLTFVDDFKKELAEAEAMPDSTPAEQIARHRAIKTAKKSIKRAAKIMKQYPEGIVEPDYSKVHAAFEMPEDTKEQRKARKTAIKKEEKIIMKFRKVALPFIDAQKLVAEEESYADMDKLREMYPDAKVRVEIAEAEAEEARKRLAAERKAELEARLGMGKKKSKKNDKTQSDEPKAEEPVVETPVEEAPVEEVVETPVEEAPVEEVVETPVVEDAPETDEKKED